MIVKQLQRNNSSNGDSGSAIGRRFSLRFLTAEDFGAVEAVARESGFSVNAWLVQVALDAAKKHLKRPHA